MYNPAMGSGVESQHGERVSSEQERLGMEVLGKAVMLLEQVPFLSAEGGVPRRSREYAVDTPKRICGWDFGPPYHSYYTHTERSSRLMLFQERRGDQPLSADVEGTSRSAWLARVSLAVPISDFDVVMHTLTFAGRPVPVLTQRIGNLLKLLEKRNEEDDPEFPFRREATLNDLREFLWLIDQARKP